jgi:endonuclease-3
MVAPDDDAARKLREVLKRLQRAYGCPRWKFWGPPVDVLIATILSQNTSKANSTAGFARLTETFPEWDAVADAPVQQIERCIHVSGLGKTKAPRIRSILRQIRKCHGRIALGFLSDMTPDEAYRYLTAFDGVGPKTAWCVLLFSVGMKVFPVDTHIHRIAIRLGVLSANASSERAHELLMPLIAPRNRYAMHVLLIEHGRRICLARRPRCERCVILQHCPHGQRRVEELCLA